MTYVYTVGQAFTEEKSLCDLYKEGYFYNYFGERVACKVGYTDNGRTFTASHIFIPKQITENGTHADAETIDLGQSKVFEVREFTVCKFPETFKIRVRDYFESTDADEVVAYWNTYCANICEEQKRVEYMEDLSNNFYDIKVPELFELVRPDTRFNLTDEFYTYDSDGFIFSFWGSELLEVLALDLDDLIEDMIAHTEAYLFNDDLKRIFKEYEDELNKYKGV